MRVLLLHKTDVSAVLSVSVLRSKNEWMILWLKNNRLLKAHPAHTACLIIFSPANKLNIAHLMYDLLSPHLKCPCKKMRKVQWIQCIQHVCVCECVGGWCYQRFILGINPSNAHYTHFLFGCCGGGNINPRFCEQFVLTFDTWIKLGRVCINIQNDNSGFLWGVHYSWGSVKHQKSILFSFLKLHGSRSLNILFQMAKV